MKFKLSNVFSSFTDFRERDNAFVYVSVKHRHKEAEETILGSLKNIENKSQHDPIKPHEKACSLLYGNAKFSMLCYL